MTTDGNHAARAATILIVDDAKDTVRFLKEPLDKVKAFRVGGADYLPKPVHETELLAQVELHVNVARLQAQLRQELHRYDILEQAVFEGIILIENGYILDANTSFCEMIGALKAELCGCPVVEFVSPSALDLFLRWLEIEAKDVIEIVLRRP